MSSKPVVIIGSGLAGLCCATHLHRRGISIRILEASDRIGGRVATDEVQGFQLDRGFQVLQTAYPEANQQLDFKELSLRRFRPGVLIRTKGRVVKMSDPWRRPTEVFATLFNGIGNLLDRWRLAKLRAHVTSGDIDKIWEQPNSTTIDYLLKECGFSEDIVNRFFKPWFRGVFLEDHLRTSSRMFRFVFRMLAAGDAALPERGMRAIPEQLASQIPPDSISLQTPVVGVDDDVVTLEGGENVQASAVVFAVREDQTRKLLNIRSDEKLTWNATTCFYFASEHPPFEEPLLFLNGDGNGPINNLCVPSNVSPCYAPKGASLISASVVGGKVGAFEQLELSVREQLQEWFGDQAGDWSLLKRYDIPFALPSKAKLPDGEVLRSSCQSHYICGDFTQSTSINGAMESGRLAAEAILKDRDER